MGFNATVRSKVTSFCKVVTGLAALTVLLTGCATTTSSPLWTQSLRNAPQTAKANAPALPAATIVTKKPKTPVPPVWRPSVQAGVTAPFAEAENTRDRIPFRRTTYPLVAADPFIQDSEDLPEDTLNDFSGIDYGSGLTSAEIEMRDRLMGQMNRFVGIRYRSGGDGINKPGFDCSGFTMRVYREALDLPLPHSSREMFDRVGVAVSKNDLAFGDLLFFRYAGKKVGHVGIYLGNGKFIHSATMHGVVVSSLDEPCYRRRYVGARRLPDLTVSGQRTEITPTER